MSEQKLTRRQQVEQYLQNPNVRRYLDTIAFAEGTEKHGYYTKFGGGRIDDLSWHPNVIWDKTGDGPTSATGRYQILKGTWAEQAKKLDLKDFGPESQDMAAVSLIMQRGAINDILNGDIDTANRKLSKEWASLPYNNSPHQHQKTTDQVLQKWEQLGGKEYSVPGQQYDYSSTQPNTHTALQAPNPQNVFADFNQSMEKTIKPIQAEALTPWNDADFEIEPQPQKSDYQAQLAEAFGVSPQGASNGLGDYVSDLVRSIYDQA